MNCIFLLGELAVLSYNTPPPHTHTLLAVIFLWNVLALLFACRLFSFIQKQILLFRCLILKEPPPSENECSHIIGNASEPLPTPAWREAVYLCVLSVSGRIVNPGSQGLCFMPCSKPHSWNLRLIEVIQLIFVKWMRGGKIERTS